MDITLLCNNTNNTIGETPDFLPEQKRVIIHLPVPKAIMHDQTRNVVPSENNTNIDNDSFAISPIYTWNLRIQTCKTECLRIREKLKCIDENAEFPCRECFLCPHPSCNTTRFWKSASTWRNHYKKDHDDNVALSPIKFIFDYDAITKTSESTDVIIHDASRSSNNKKRRMDDINEIVDMTCDIKNTPNIKSVSVQKREEYIKTKLALEKSLSVMEAEIERLESFKNDFLVKLIQTAQKMNVPYEKVSDHINRHTDMQKSQKTNGSATQKLIHTNINTKNVIPYSSIRSVDTIHTMLI